MSNEEYELDPEVKKLDESNRRIEQVKEHFAKEALTEDVLQRYAELKFEHKRMGDLLETMKDSIEKGRDPGQEQLSVGKMAVFFKDIEPSAKIEWARLVKDLIGDVDEETLARYTVPGREGYTQVTVRKL